MKQLTELFIAVGTILLLTVMTYHVPTATNRTVKSTGPNSVVTTALFRPVDSTAMFTHVNSIFSPC